MGRSSSADQQKQYQHMFREDTLATYASRFDSYSGQTFKIKDVKDAPAAAARWTQ